MVGDLVGDVTSQRAFQSKSQCMEDGCC